MPLSSPGMHPMGSPPFRSGAPPPMMADRIIRSRKGSPPQIQFSELSAEEISQTIDCLVEANGLTDAFLLNAIDHRTQRLNLRSCYHIRKYTLGMIAHQCPRLEVLDLTNCRQVDSRMVTNLLTQCPHLRELRLEGCVRVTDAAFFPTEMKGSTVPGLRHLKKLFLGGCRQITEDALLRLARICVNLTDLSLAGCRSSVSLKVMHSFFDLSLKHQRLTSIDLSDCAVLGSDDAFIQYEYKVNVIGKYIPVREIKLAGMAGLPPRYTHKSIRALASICGPHLQVLETTWCGGFSDESCFALAQNCPNIAELGICNSLVTMNGIVILANALTKLTRLDLSWCVKVNGPVVSCIAKSMPTLRSLSLSHCVDFLAASDKAAISSKHVQELVQSIGARLEVLDLTGLPHVVDADLVRALQQYCPFISSFSGTVHGGAGDITSLRSAFESCQWESLVTLNLDFSRVHAHVESVINFATSPFPNLEKLVITCNPKFTASDLLLESILSNRTNLHHLELRNCGGVSADLFSSWIQGYSPDREAALLVEAMIDHELHKGYISSSSIDRPNTVMFASDSEAAPPTVVFRGHQRPHMRKKTRNFIISSASETDTLVAGFELLKTALVLNEAARAMDSLGTLILTGATQLNDASVDRLSLMATYLERLEITDAKQLTEECMEPLRRRCKLLRGIEISGPQIRVRIDSSRFCNKRKRNRGQLPPPLKRKSSKRSTDTEDN